MVCKKCVVGGRVQGVFYRATAARRARELGINGYARNLPDGRVEVYALGSESALAKLRAELGRGPQGAFVSSVAEEDAPLLEQFSKRFSIEH